MFFFDDDVTQEPWKQENEAPKIAVAVTTQPFPLVLQEIEHEDVLDDAICVGTFVDGRMVARCVVPDRESLDILRRIIGDAAPLLYAAREKDRGLDGRLCALVPFGRVRAELEARETEDEPWKASLPDPDAWKGDSFSEPAISEHELVPIPLGVIVRIPADRKHPDNLELETLSVLHSLLQKGASEVVDRLLSNLD